jgi:hypothetical protein
MDRFVDNKNPSRGYDAWKATDRDGDELLSQHPSGRSSIPPIRMPRPPCQKLQLCGKGAAHLGPCDTTERLELVPSKL